MFKKISLSLIVVLGIVFLVGYAQRTSIQNAENNAVLENRDPNPISEIGEGNAKIEVVHFHGTRQCWACITVGKYALQTIKEKFPEEYKEGIILFKDINGELPENRNIVIKYQARGSSLFINTIVDGQETIEEDINVWRLVANKDRFMDYFQVRLDKILNE